MRFHRGLKVRTVKSEQEAQDWTEEALATRRWGVVGKITSISNRHGLVYTVEHKDGSTSFYEEHELEEAGRVELYNDKGEHVITVLLSEKGEEEYAAGNNDLSSGELVDVILDVKGLSKCEF